MIRSKRIKFRLAESILYFQIYRKEFPIAEYLDGDKKLRFYELSSKEMNEFFGTVVIPEEVFDLAREYLKGIGIEYHE